MNSERKMPLIWKILALLLTMSFLMVASVTAQDVAVGQATATVQTPLTVTAAAALAYPRRVARNADRHQLRRKCLPSPSR